MHIHVLGIGGTFMSALALLAREAGYVVTGSDENCYPPVSDLLKSKGIEWTEGFEEGKQALEADCVIVGNVIKRGMPVLEAVLNKGKNYTSGPQWLAENILKQYRVLAVAGTHGKTTTTSMLAFILQEAGLNPGFLVGGVAPNFNTSALLGKGEWFVIEADEYDSAFFDKRPKLMHYRPEIALLNNLEFDHADIYTNLEAIQQQFHFYLKTIPSQGVVLFPRNDTALKAVIAKGIYSKKEDMALDEKAVWRAELLDESGGAFRIWHKGIVKAELHWPLIGRFNVENGLAAIAASSHAGVSIETAARALAKFSPVKRRLEVKYNDRGITLYDDFAHHPTAISKTLLALRQSQRHQRILLVMEFASYTMKTGIHNDSMAQALVEADKVFILEPKAFDLASIIQDWPGDYTLLSSTDAIIDVLLKEMRRGDAIIIMSNRGFNNIHQTLVERLNFS